MDKPRGWRKWVLRFAEIFALKAVESFGPPCMKNIHEVLSKAEPLRVRRDFEASLPPDAGDTEHDLNKFRRAFLVVGDEETVYC